ncbi:MAG TPA: diguanylate cyclase [Bacillota bacterium]
MAENRKPLVLMVDDNPHNLRILTEMMEENGYETIVALSGKKALELVTIEKPDLILLDVKMPEMDGYEVCRILKADSLTRDIPVIFITVQSDVDDVIKGFESGAVDYISKPFNILELQMRTKTHLEVKQARDAQKLYNEELEKTNLELKKANEIIRTQNEQLREIAFRLEQLSQTDALTGLYNRRYLIEKLEEEVARYQRNRKPFSLIIADIDDFKSINDSYGHECGDYILKQIAKILTVSVRDIDSIGRWGGEEFLILLPETPVNGAQILAERIKNNLHNNVIVYNGTLISATLTFGIAMFEGEATVDAVIRQADYCLYEGKRKGKDCIIVQID